MESSRWRWTQVGSSWRFSPRFQTALALGPACLVALPLLWKTPLSHDHPTHAFKAWHFWTEMLGRGRLRGWSHFWGFGFPADELVPSGGELWVGLFRALSLGQLSWLRTYALAVAGLLVFKVLAAHIFARRYFGPAAAVVAAWLATFDLGAFSEGGWVWNMSWGVWPVSLSMSFCSLAFVELDRIARRGRSWRVPCAGLLIAAALLTHQVALLVLAVALPLQLVDPCLAKRRAPVRASAAFAHAVLLGALLSAFSIVPFLARSRYTMDLGAAGKPLPQVLLHLLELRTFSKMSPVVHALALCGAWLALRVRCRGAVFFGASALSFVLLSSNLLTYVLHLEQLFPSLIKIEAARMLLVAKLFWLPLAGYAAVRIFRGLGAKWPGPLAKDRALRVGLRALLAAALIVPAAPQIYQTWVVAGIQGEAETPYWADLERVFAWAKALRASQPGHYRIAYRLPPDDHSSTLGPVFGGGLMYKIGDTPTQIFEGLPMTDGPEMLEALSVSHVVSSSPLAEPSFTLERTIGALGIYRFNAFRSDPFDLDGPGRAELLELGPERMRVRLTETSPTSRLRIHVASYERWQATIDGARVPITTVAVHGAEDPVLMEVPARAGELLLEYVDGVPDRVGRWLTASAVPVFVALTLLGRRRAPIRIARRRWRPSWRLGVGSALALVLGLALALRARARADVLGAGSIFHSDVQLSASGQLCERRGALDFQCGPDRVAAGLVHARGDHLCMSAPNIAELRVRLHAPLGSFLAGRYDAKGTPGVIQARLDGLPLGRVETRPAYMRQQYIQFDTRDRAGQDAELELVLGGGALRCFDFWRL